MNEEILRLINNLEILNNGELLFKEDLQYIANLYIDDCDITVSRLNEEIENLINC